MMSPGGMEQESHFSKILTHLSFLPNNLVKVRDVS
jgi:hypothetical protein